MKATPYKKEFIEFLKEYRVYASFMKLFKTSFMPENIAYHNTIHGSNTTKENFFSNITPELWISTAFYWSTDNHKDGLSGYDYWGKIDKYWKNKINDIIIK